MKTNHTPGPWKVGQWDENAGYDCMTGGIKAGPVVLDGKDYGQASCCPISADILARMEADARLIGSAPDLLAVNAELVALLERARVTIDAAFNTKVCGDIFGMHHNQALDDLSAIEEMLARVEAIKKGPAK